MSTYLANQVDGYEQQIRTLEQRLTETQIVNSYLQENNRVAMNDLNKLKDELKDRDDRLKVSQQVPFVCPFSSRQSCRSVGSASSA